MSDFRTLNPKTFIANVHIFSDILSPFAYLLQLDYPIDIFST